MTIAIFGASGNMGKRVLKELLNEEYIESFNILVHDTKVAKKIVKKSKIKKNVNYIEGSIADESTVKKMVEGVDYVLNMAAVIPPLSDKKPLKAIEANEKGPKVLTKVIESIKENQPKLIHISTIGVYGDRNYKHPFAEVGDPLLPSPFDIYALTKMRGEFTVLESEVKTWVVIRQTAMLYDELMNKNISDGLMFHTCFNTPLEWATANDSALLIRNILRRDLKGELDENNFWKHCFNIGGGESNRVTGYDTFELGFKIIGCGTKDFFDTNYNSIRNFHGEWYSDGHKLNDLFDYQHEDIEGFWDHVLETHRYFSLAHIVPKRLLKKFVIKRLLKDNNAPHYWYKHQDEAKMLAYFNGKEKFESIPKEWEKFHLLKDGFTPDGDKIDYEKLRSNPTRLNHYFDIDKDRKLINEEDLKNVAKAHGGKLLTEGFKTGDIFCKVEWENSDGERFVARPHSVLFCGHWINRSYKENVWDFDRLAKKDKLYAEIWYDSHLKDENRLYYYDENYHAHYLNIK